MTDASEASKDTMDSLIAKSSLGTSEARRLRSLSVPAMADRLRSLGERRRAAALSAANELLVALRTKQWPGSPSRRAGPRSRARTDEAETTWMEHGACADLDYSMFFPDDEEGVEQARRICVTCPVQDPCLDYALANHLDHGVWGGTSEWERRRMSWRGQKRPRPDQVVGHISEPAAKVVGGHPVFVSGHCTQALEDTGSSGVGWT